MNFVGKPCAGKPHARFDEGGRRRIRLNLSLLYRRRELNKARVSPGFIFYNLFHGSIISFNEFDIHFFQFSKHRKINISIDGTEYTSGSDIAIQDHFHGNCSR